jgi:hypothetical protein
MALQSPTASGTANGPSVQYPITISNLKTGTLAIAGSPQKYNLYPSPINTSGTLGSLAVYPGKPDELVKYEASIQNVPASGNPGVFYTYSFGLSQDDASELVFVTDSFQSKICFDNSFNPISDPKSPLCKDSSYGGSTLMCEPQN